MIARSIATALVVAVVVTLAAPAQAWDKRLVDSDRRDSPASIAFSSKGAATLAWWHRHSKELVLARRGSAHWSKIVVSGAGVPGQCYSDDHPLLAFGPDQSAPVIVSYCQHSTVQREPIFLTTRDASGAWSTVMIAKTPESLPGFCSEWVTGIDLAFDPATGLPMIAYGDSGTESVHWVHWNGSSWADNVVFTYSHCGPAGPMVSMSVDPLTRGIGLAWTGNSGGPIEFSEYDGTWSPPETVESTGAAMEFQLRHGPNGVLWLAFSELFGMGDTRLRMASRVEGSWSFETISQHMEASMGSPSIAFEGDLPRVAFRDVREPVSRFSVRLASFDGTFWHVEPVARGSGVIFTPELAIADDGSTAIVYLDDARHRLDWSTR